MTHLAHWESGGVDGITLRSRDNWGPPKLQKRDCLGGKGNIKEKYNGRTIKASLNKLDNKIIWPKWLKAQKKTEYANTINSDPGMVISPPCVFLHGQITSCGPRCVRLSCSRGISSEGDDILQVGICYLNCEIRRNATASGQPFLFTVATPSSLLCYWNHSNWKPRQLTTVIGWSPFTSLSRTRNNCYIQLSLPLSSESDLHTLPGQVSTIWLSRGPAQFLACWFSSQVLKTECLVL